MLEVKRKSILAHSAKVAGCTVAVFVIVALASRTWKTDRTELPKGYADGQDAHVSREALTRFPASLAELPLLIPVLSLAVEDPSIERSWTEALGNRIGGAIEAKTDMGRADVLTDVYAVEVDFPAKWKEGLGQAICYGRATKKIACLAIIDDAGLRDRKGADSLDLPEIESACVDKGVRLLLLRREANGSAR